MRRQVAIFTHLELYLVPLKTILLHDDFSAKFLSFTDDHHATPVQDMAQWRQRRRPAVGTHFKDSFQIKTLCKPFSLSLVDTHPPVSCHNRGGGWRLGMWPRQNFCAYLDTKGFFTKGSILARLHKDRIP